MFTTNINVTPLWTLIHLTKVATFQQSLLIVAKIKLSTSIIWKKLWRYYWIKRFTCQCINVSIDLVHKGYSHAWTRQFKQTLKVSKAILWKVLLWKCCLLQIIIRVIFVKVHNEKQRTMLISNYVIFFLNRNVKHNILVYNNVLLFFIFSMEKKLENFNHLWKNRTLRIGFNHR